MNGGLARSTSEARETAASVPLLDLSHCLESIGPLARWTRIRCEGEGSGLPHVHALSNAALARTHVDAFAREHDIPDARVAASQWSKRWLVSVVPAPLALFTLTGADPVPLLADARLEFADATPAALLLPDARLETRNDGTRERAFAALFGGLVAPTLHAVAAATGLGTRVLWGNAGNIVQWVFEEMEKDPRADVRRVREDREALHATDATILGVDARALADAVRYETVGSGECAQVQRVRTTCCLKDRVPGGTPCYSCPLISTEERTRLLALAKGRS